MEAQTYKIRYGILDPNIIFNEIGPCSGGPYGWDEETIKKREEKAQKHIAAMNEATGFFDKLEESILKEGFRNPILVNAGFCPVAHLKGKNIMLPLMMAEDHSKILSCNTNGGSRLWVAQKHNLRIPCVISDFVDRFPIMATLKSDERVIRGFYKDEPGEILFTCDGIKIRHLPQVF